MDERRVDVRRELVNVAPADEVWALRCDFDFDRYQAKQRNGGFEVLEHSVDSDGRHERTSGGHAHAHGVLGVPTCPVLEQAAADKRRAELEKQYDQIRSKNDEREKELVENKRKAQEKQHAKMSQLFRR